MLLRPLLGVPRSAIRAYAADARPGWIEDESNADEATDAEFHPPPGRAAARVEVSALAREPRARGAPFRRRRARCARLLRAYLKGKGLRAPSEAKLVEMLKQLGRRGARDRARRRGSSPLPGQDLSGQRGIPESPFKPVAWHGESRLALPALTANCASTRVARPRHRQRVVADSTRSRSACAPAESACGPMRAGRAARSRTCFRKPACRPGSASACR